MTRVSIRVDGFAAAEGFIVLFSLKLDL